jgi:predicted MFS family arabinose efflux permease
MNVSARTLFLALFPFACGYFASQLLRAVNAVIAPRLVQDFGIGPAELGLLTSAYLLTFSIFQLPLGVMLDRYGPRRVQTVLLLIAAAGCLAFAASRSFPELFVARAVVGLGFSAGLMASYKSSATWVPTERRALANSTIMSAGALGVVVSTIPTDYLVGEIGWRGAFMVFAACIVLIAGFVFLTVPEPRPTSSKGSPFRQQWSEMLAIMKTRLFWRVAPMLALSAGIAMAYQTLWAGPWHRDVAGFGQPQVAHALFWMAVTFMVGTLCSGVLADRLQTRGISPMQTLSGLLVIHTVSQALIILAPPEIARWGWLGLAATSQTAILSFAWFASQIGDGLAGRANATINFAMFVAAFAVQYFVGVIISFFPPPATGYAPEGYAWAFGTFLILQIAAILWYLVMPHQRSLS